jgi:hypothetical protein
VTGHNDAVFGHTVSFAVVPRMKIGIAYFTNTNAKGTTVRQEYEVLKKLLPPIRAWQHRRKAELTKGLIARLRRYTGSYQLTKATVFDPRTHANNPGTLKLELQEDHLHWVLSIPALKFIDFTFDLEPYSEKVYRLIEPDVGGEFVEFRTDGAKATDRFLWRDFVFERGRPAGKK